MFTFVSRPSMRDRYLSLPKDRYLSNKKTFLVIYNSDSDQYPSITIVSVEDFDYVLSTKNYLSRHYLLSLFESGKIDNFKISRVTSSKQISIYHNIYFPQSTDVLVSYTNNHHEINEIIKSLMRQTI